MLPRPFADSGFRHDPENSRASALSGTIPQPTSLLTRITQARLDRAACSKSRVAASMSWSRILASQSVRQSTTMASLAADRIASGSATGASMVVKSGPRSGAVLLDALAHFFVSGFGCGDED